MKTQMVIVAVIVFVFLASHAFTPPAPLISAEKSEKLFEPQADGPKMGPSQSLVPVTEPILLLRRELFDTIIKAGIAESQRGRRLKDRDVDLILDLFQGDLVRLSVPYGEPAVELSGEITYLLKPGEQVYLRAAGVVPKEVFVAIDGQKTDKIVFNMM